MNARTSCLSPLNGGINYKAALTLIKSPLNWETLLFVVLRELEMAESMGKVMLSKGLL